MNPEFIQNHISANSKQFVLQKYLDNIDINTNNKYKILHQVQQT